MARPCKDGRVLEIGRLRISRELISHPLLGRAHVIECEDVPLTAISEVDWEHPTTIPAIAAPGKLPPGEGARLLNAIAERARAAVQRMIALPPPEKPARYDLVKARHHVDVELI